jgi:hypothetical protein
LDFVGVAAHELGHALGFVSGVDTVDRVSEPNGPLDPTGGDPDTPPVGFDLDTFAVFSVLDLYRFSEDSPQLDLRYGGAPFFSIDGGATRGLRFATGEFNGDGDQASHWIDDQNLGPIMLGPSVRQGEELFIIPLDVVAFDVIGYDRFVPEAPTLLLVGLGVVALGLLASKAREVS